MLYKWQDCVLAVACEHRIPGNFYGMYISRLCILCGFLHFKFHRYLLVKNFHVLNFTQKLLISGDFCAQQHSNEGFLFLLSDGPLYQYQLSLAPQQKGREHFFIRVHNV